VGTEIIPRNQACLLGGANPDHLGANYLVRGEEARVGEWWNHGGSAKMLKFHLVKET